MSATLLPFAAERFGAELRHALAAPGWTVETWQDDEGDDVAGFCNARGDGAARFVAGWEGRKLALWDTQDPWGDPVGTFGTGAELVAAVRRMVRA